MPDCDKISYSGLFGNRRLLSEGLPILTFHKIALPPPHAKARRLYLSPKCFAQQVEELATAGFSTARLSDPLPIKGNPARKIALTFNGGYCSAFQHALPVLSRHRFIAMQFIVTSQIRGYNAWEFSQGDAPVTLMSADEIREWLRLGHDIGSQSITHSRLTTLSPDELREEVGASKRRLEDLFGIPILHFCYPYGDYDTRVSDEVARAGYHTACTRWQNSPNVETTSRFKLRRIESCHAHLGIILPTILRRWIALRLPR